MPVFDGSVEVSELLGEEILAHMVNGEHRYTVSVDPHAKVNLDGTLHVCPDMSRAHIFDAETEQNLTMPA